MQNQSSNAFTCQFLFLMENISQSESHWPERLCQTQVCGAACGSLGLFGNSLFQYIGVRLLANRAGLRLVLPARWCKYADYFSESSHATTEVTGAGEGMAVY